MKELLQQLENDLKEGQFRRSDWQSKIKLGIKLRMDWDYLPTAAWDTQGNFVYANQKFLALLGYTLEEFTAIPIAQHIHPESRPIAMEVYLKNMHLQRHLTLEVDLWYLKSDGYKKLLTWAPAFTDFSVGVGAGQIIKVNNQPYIDA